jgi:hypothetical protein
VPDRSVAFYRGGLGWPTQGIVGREFHDEVVPMGSRAQPPA